MSLVKVGRIGSLPPGSLSQVENGGVAYVICNLEGELHCLDGICPHAGGPLGQGNLNGSFVVCPWHGWEFDCRTGVNDFDQDLRVKTFPVVVRGEDILIDIS